MGYSSSSTGVQNPGNEIRDAMAQFPDWRKQFRRPLANVVAHYLRNWGKFLEDRASYQADAVVKEPEPDKYTGDYAKYRADGNAHIPICLHCGNDVVVAGEPCSECNFEVSAEVKA